MFEALQTFRAHSAAIVLMLERAIDGEGTIDASQLEALEQLASQAKCPTLARRAQTLQDMIRPRVPARHRTRVCRFTAARAGKPDNSPSTPFTRAACRAGARYEWDDIDERADTEAVSLEWMDDVTGRFDDGSWEFSGGYFTNNKREIRLNRWESAARMQPHVERGLMISAAMARGLYDPDNAHDVAHFRTKGHFQKQNAQRASERVAAGGIGKREIVTRADKERRIVKAAARRLDMLSAQVTKETSPLLLQALEIVRGILRPV